MRIRPFSYSLMYPQKGRSWGEKYLMDDKHYWESKTGKGGSALGWRKAAIWRSGLEGLQEEKLKQRLEGSERAGHKASISHMICRSQGDLAGKEFTCNAGNMGPIPGLGRCPGEGNGTPVFLPGESHGLRSLADHSPQSCQESDMTEVTEHIHTRKVKMWGHCYQIVNI